MAFDAHLAERLRDALLSHPELTEQKLFGCVCFFLHGHAAVGVWKDRLIVRLGPDEAEASLRESHVRAFDITGKPMRNWVCVELAGLETDEALWEWIERGLQFVRTLPRKGTKSTKRGPR